GELEVVAEATLLLQSLGEHFVLPDVIVRHGSSGELHRLFEVSSRNGGDGVGCLLFIHHFLSLRPPLLSLLLCPNLLLDRFANRHLARSLTDLGQIGSGESDSA
ncbi:hypothetical protein PMAYCL1PPCAC_13446, partial [Pristionchus mayeri]